MIYWFTGQPGSGKTTLAKHLETYISSTEKVIHIDGDDLRNIFNNKDYSEEGRRKNIERAQDISLFMSNKGFEVVVSLVSPFINQRENFKSKLGENIKEIYVHTKNIRGREDFHVMDYEQPISNFVEIDTTDRSIVESSVELFSKLLI
jgi:adenylylsulfate kinase-like enzyme